MRGKANMSSRSSKLKDNWMMVLHSWEFWKPVSRAMVRHLNKDHNVRNVPLQIVVHMWTGLRHRHGEKYRHFLQKNPHHMALPDVS